MKRRFLVLLALVFTASSLFSQTILWSGEEAISWNTGTYVTLDASKFTTAEVADHIVFSLEVTGAASTWPQVALNNGSTWSSLPGAGNSLLQAGQTSVTYSITTDMLSDVLGGGIIVTGSGYTLKKVTLEKGPGSAGLENAVWIGPVVIPDSWGAINLPASSFKKAKVGNILRLRYTNTGTSAMHTLVDKDWKEIPGYGFYSMTGIYYDYTIDQTLLTVLQGGGCIINGCSYTMTSVDVIDPSEKTTLTCSVPVNNGWVFTDTKPEVLINISNPYAENKSVNAEIRVFTDKGAALTTVKKSVEVAANGSTQAHLSFDAEPGFYKIIPLVDGEAVYTSGTLDGKQISSFFIGVKPEEVVSATDSQADFMEFWQQTKAELAKVSPDYILTEIPEKCTAKRNVYLLEYKSLPDANGNAAIARAYYAEPTDGKKHPVLIHFQGYDGGTGTPWCMGGNDNDYCELIVSTRGQVINNRSPYTNPYGDWFAYGFDSKEHWYYRGAFMDCVRAVDFVCSRDAADVGNIFAEGGSQGGALTIAAAALSDHPFRAIAPAIPFLGDYPDYFQIVSWPANVAIQQRNKLGMSDEAMYRMLSYFDTKNLAPLISCPVIESVGLQDNVCPPHTNLAPYNNFSSTEKQIFYNPLLGHSTSGTWWSTMMEFFRSHTVTSDVSSPSLSGSEINSDAMPIYTVSGQRVTRNMLRHGGVYIHGGHKYVVK